MLPHIPVKLRGEDEKCSKWLYTSDAEMIILCLNGGAAQILVPAHLTESILSIETNKVFDPHAHKRGSLPLGESLVTAVQAQVLLCSAKIVFWSALTSSRCLYFLLVLQKCKNNVNFDTYFIAFLNGAIMLLNKAVFSPALASLRLVSQYFIIELKSISTELWYNTKSSVHLIS